MSTILWRAATLGFLATIYTAMKIDTDTAQQIGQATCLTMLGATMATLWDF